MVVASHAAHSPKSTPRRAAPPGAPKSPRAAAARAGLPRLRRLRVGGPHCAGTLRPPGRTRGARDASRPDAHGRQRAPRDRDLSRRSVRLRRGGARAPLRLGLEVPRGDGRGARLHAARTLPGDDGHRPERRVSVRRERELPWRHGAVVGVGGQHGGARRGEARPHVRHAARLASQPPGTRHYSACMMDDLLVEIDAGSFAVTRHFILTAGHERGVAGAPPAHAMTATSSLTCVPTWAQPSNDGSIVYVACNKSNDIAAVDAKEWKLLHRMPAGNGVYNLAMTQDGRLIATNKRGQSVSVFDPASDRELARLPTKRKVVHGVVVSPDDRYAFVTVEGIGTEPGTKA